MDNDLAHMHHAIQLALEAEQTGNLPVGSVITLDGNVIGEGKNTIWAPRFRPNRHAEIEAIETVPSELWAKANQMTLYTTLEPCLMCMSTILLHRIGRVVFGSSDNRGGASSAFGHLPPSFEKLLQPVEWVGPTLPQECDNLKVRVEALITEWKKRSGLS
jgi:tRNA(adenine34) deaminase